MRRHWPWLLWALAGCSTHPVADVLDYFSPGRVGTNDVPPYGGVCIPQGPIQPPLPAPGPDLVPGPAPSIIPPPAPLPGTAPAPAVPPPPSFPAVPPGR